MIDARGHAKAVEFDLMEPSRSGRRLLDRLGKLRRNEAGKGRASAGRTRLDGPRSRTLNDTRHCWKPNSEESLVDQRQYATIGSAQRQLEAALDANAALGVQAEQPQAPARCGRIHGGAGISSAPATS
jgi:hypothetical protein